MQAHSDDIIGNIVRWIIIAGFWISQLGGIFIALLSTIGSLLVIFYFIYSLARFRLRMLSPAAKLVRLCMVLLSICDLGLSLLFIISTSFDLLWDLIEQALPSWAPVFDSIALVGDIALHSTALTEAFASLSLAISVLLAALHTFKYHSLRSMWPLLLSFFGVSFIFPFISFIAWTFILQFIADDSSDIPIIIHLWGTGFIMALCTIALVIIYASIFILAKRRKKHDHIPRPLEQQSLVKFSRYLFPFVLCVSLQILFCFLLPFQDAPAITSNPILLLGSQFIFNVYDFVYPLQGFLNCIILLLNSRKSFIKSLSWPRRRRRNGEVGQLYTDNDDDDDDEEAMSIDWAEDTPYRAPFLGNQLVIPNNAHIKSPTASQERYSMRLYPRTESPGSNIHSNSISKSTGQHRGSATQ